MSRSFPVIALALFVTGAATSSTIVPGTIVSAYSKPAAPQSDEMANKVKEALKADASLNGAADAVTVTAAGGVVTLEGTAPTPQVRAKIGEAALKVQGVEKLVNKIKLPKN